MTQATDKPTVAHRKRGPKKTTEIRRLKKAVIDKLRAGCSYTSAAEQLGIERNSIKAWRDSDELFEAACNYAREMAVERVEDALYEAALKVADNSRYTTAAIFFLKNRAPARWRDANDARQTSDIQRIVDALTPDQLARLVSNLAVDLSKSVAPDPGGYTF